jgi:hypothetical protein
MSLSLRRTLIAASAIPLGASSCVLPDLSLDGRPCPCDAGFVCDEAANVCVSELEPTSSSMTGSNNTTSTTSSTSDGGGSTTGPGPGGGGAGVGAAGGGGSEPIGGTGEGGTGGSPPLSGTCDDPISIGDPGGVLATTVGQGNDLEPNCIGGGGPDLVYVVMAAIDGTMEITLFSAAELVLYARSDCSDPTTELLCVDKGGLNDFENGSITVTQGQVIYLIVDGHTDEESDFSLDVKTVPP